MSLPFINVQYLTQHAFQARSQSVSRSLESKLRTLFSQMGFFPMLFDFCLKTVYCFCGILENRID